MSVSLRAGPPHSGHFVFDPLLRGLQRRAPLRRVVLDVRQLHRQLVLGHRHDPAALAVDDRDRAAPVALARDQPVAQAVVDRRVALALAVQPRDDRAERLAVGHAVEVRVRVDEQAVAGVRQTLLGGLGRARVGVRRGAGWAFDHAADRQLVRARESVVALVVPRHRHDRAGAVLHQHVVGDVHRDLLAVDRVGDRAPQRHARLRLLGVAALLVGLVQRVVDVLVHLLLVRGPLGEARDVGVLGRHHEERRAEQRVRARREHRVVDRVGGSRSSQRNVTSAPSRAPDPVALHRLDVLGPLDPVEVAQQPLGVVGDPQEPLLELADFDQRAAALAVPVRFDLLVGEHRLVFRAPLDRRLLAVGRAPPRTAAGRSTASSGSSAVRGSPARATSRSRCPSGGTRAGRTRSTRPSSRAGARRS